MLFECYDCVVCASLKRSTEFGTYTNSIKFLTTHNSSTNSDRLMVVSIFKPLLSRIHNTLYYFLEIRLLLAMIAIAGFYGLKTVSFTPLTFCCTPITHSNQRLCSIQAEEPLSETQRRKNPEITVDGSRECQIGNICSMALGLIIVRIVHILG